MELGPRDRLSQAFVKELEKGRTIDTPYGPVVHLDLRHLGAKKINAKLPFVRELCLKYQNIDPVTELIPVRPVVHYMMGGVHTDINGATPLAGPVRRRRSRVREHQRREPARVQLAARAARVRRPRGHGGRRVRVEPQRRPAVRASSRRRKTKSAGCRAASAASRARARDGSPTSATRCRRPWKKAPASTGPARRSPRPRPRCGRCRSDSRNVAIDDHSQTFNTERISALELAFMLDVAEAIANAAVTREESRGAHQRTDFPGRDDEQYLAHSLVSRNADGSSTVGYLPVTITRWPPGERVYGR